MRGYGCWTSCLKDRASLREMYFTLKLLRVGRKTFPRLTTNHFKSTAAIRRGRMRQVEYVTGSCIVDPACRRIRTGCLFKDPATTTIFGSILSDQLALLGRAQPAPHGERRLKMLTYAKHVYTMIRMEVASSRPDHLPTLSAAKTSELSLHVKLPFCWLSGRCRQSYSDFLIMCAGDIEADHTDSGIAMDCADRNRETPHLGH